MAARSRSPGCTGNRGRLDAGVRRRGVLLSPGFQRQRNAVSRCKRFSILIVRGYEMFERILKQFREKIRAAQFVVTLHAVEELEDEELSVLDVEQAILTGTITRRQKDADTGEWKYLVSGSTLSRDDVVVVAKLSPTDKLVIITIYAEASE